MHYSGSGPVQVVPQPDSTPPEPTLPTGTVTFLFTDIEGSTRLLGEHPGTYPAALARHDALLRDAIESRGGCVFETVGDAFYAAFARPSEAVSAALAAQGALHAEPWGELGELRARMALHTGEVERRGNHYFGVALYRCARLMAIGHGGQTLLSGVTAELVQDSLPAGAQLEGRGVHRLKDLIHPESVFELLHPELPADFPPLRSLSTFPNNLPAQVTSFVGREREIEGVCALLRQSEVRLVTLTGPGGTGKTRLALAVAAELLGEFKNGVFFVDLAPIADPAVVLSTLARALAIRESAGRPLADTLRRDLGDKQMLLVCDNFEQVLPAAGDVAELLRSCPEMKVLVTSRIVLHVYGENEVMVPPLSLPDPRHPPELQALSEYEAVALFIQRARAVKPDFQVTNATAPALAEICAQLDGLPLAVELAAARAKLLPLPSLLARLSRRLTLLTGGPRNLPVRQQTLRETIDWSYELLEDTERTLFARLAVFVGTFGLEAAESVCDLQLNVLDGISSLVDKSLLRCTEGTAGTPRFRMLETIREYAWERLEARGDAAMVRLRHTEYFLGLIQQAEPELRGPRQAEWFAQLEADHDNLRALLQCASESRDVELLLRVGGALWLFWWAHAHAREGYRWLEVALAASHELQTLAPGLRENAFNAAGALAYVLGDYERGAALYGQALELRRAAGDTAGVAASLTNLGMVAHYQGNFQRAVELYQEALSVSRENGHVRGLASALNNLGPTLREQGRYAEAVAALDEALALFRKLGDTRCVADSLNGLGSLAYARGDRTLAFELSSQALVLFRGLGDKPGTAESMQHLARAAMGRGELDQAVSFFRESLTIARELDDKWGAAISLTGLGQLAQRRGEFTEAIGLYRESLAVCREVDDKPGSVVAVERLANVDSAVHRPRRAAHLFAAAASAREQMGSSLPPSEHAERDGAVAFARAEIGETAFVTAWREGQAMGLAEATELALGPGAD